MTIESTPHPAKQKWAREILWFCMGLFVFYLLIFVIFGYQPGDWRSIAMVLTLACLAKAQIDWPRRRMWLVLAFVGIGLAAIGRILKG
ncbi:MAG: hypothetical protein WEF86_17015 [Gemmatimonadota bacterium]